MEAEDEQPGSLLARLLVALGSASTEPLLPAESAAWTPPNAAPTFDTRKARLVSRLGMMTRPAVDKLSAV